MMTLKEIMDLNNNYGFDICDETFDWGTYFYADFEEEKGDSYNDLMCLFAEEIVCIKYKKDYYSICQVSQFILSYKEAFDRFMNEENNEFYKPKNYDNITMNDGDFEIYLLTFENLIIGNYSNSDYEKLYNYIIECKK